MTLAAYNKDLSISHLHGSNGVTEKIKKAMYESAKQFVYIGFLLKEVRDYSYYEEGGYENVYEYAEFELGFKKSSTKNFIAIAETFGIQKWDYQGIRRETQTMSLQPAYENFNYSQLVELLAMSDAQRKQAKQYMTVKQLREIKKQPEKVEQVTIEELEAQVTGQTSGQICESGNSWISVNSGLPENDKRVLVCCETKAGQRNINLAYFDGNAWHGNGSMAGVTHWMELPALPMLKRDQQAKQTITVNNY